MQTRSLPVPFEALNREVVGAVGPTSLPLDPCKMGQVSHQSAVPVAGAMAARGNDAANATPTAASTETDSTLNPTKVSHLTKGHTQSITHPQL